MKTEHEKILEFRKEMPQTSNYSHISFPLIEFFFGITDFLSDFFQNIVNFKSGQSMGSYENRIYNFLSQLLKPIQVLLDKYYSSKFSSMSVCITC